MFDKEFPSGVSFGGSANRGYKLCKMSFINLSHAVRNGLYKPLVVNKTVNQTSNSERQVCSCLFVSKNVPYIIKLVHYNMV